MTDYYSAKLAGERLRRCYEIASPRIRQYLEAEIGFVLKRLSATDEVLELGCGYGRVVFRLAEVARRVVGIDTAEESLALARELAGPSSNCAFECMDASSMTFPVGTFDVVVCVQNGICSFRADPERLVLESLRVAKPGGRILFSSYSERFWPARLEWFRAQAAEELVGEIDENETAGGTIVCKDGFRSGTFTPDEFRGLCSRLGVLPEIFEVDESSVFCEIEVPGLSTSQKP